MRYYTTNPIQQAEAKNRLSLLCQKGAVVEIIEKKKNRSIAQNRALHLYFSFIADGLNSLGLTHDYANPITGEAFSLKYHPETVKERIWKPMQKQLFDKDSTTQLNTMEINELIDVFTNFFGERGYDIEFPSYENLIKQEQWRY